MLHANADKKRCSEHDCNESSGLKGERTTQAMNAFDKYLCLHRQNKNLDIGMAATPGGARSNITVFTKQAGTGFDARAMYGNRTSQL